MIVSDVPTVDPVEELKKGDTVRISPARVDKVRGRGGVEGEERAGNQEDEEGGGRRRRRRRPLH